MSKVPREVQEVLDELSEDPRYMGICPSCEESFRLKDSHLFYSDNLTPEAQWTRAQLIESLAELKLDYELLKKRILQGAPKKSLEVIFGQVAEKVAPVMPRFPYDINDCRFLGDPIDYVIFSGLSSDSHVNQIVFADVKTGEAKLNPHQKQAKEALESGRITVRLY